MCDDHTPLEFGWVFKPTGETSVQYAIEALSPTDGTPCSPTENLEILSSLATNGQCERFDLSWSNKCTQSLLYPSHLLSRKHQRESQFFIGENPPPFSHRNSHLRWHLGVDNARTGLGLKAYFLPEVRSKMTGIPVMDIITSAINDLGMGIPWSRATSYFSTLPKEFKIQGVIAAVDCVPDAENRFKVYVRTQATHLSALCDMLTLGGQLKGSAIDSTLEKLREIWHALFGPISDDTRVEHKQPNAGPTGFLFYYEMALGNPFPIPKIYIPAARFLDSDAHVAQVISEFVGSCYYDDLKLLL